MIRRRPSRISIGYRLMVPRKMGAASVHNLEALGDDIPFGRILDLDRPPTVRATAPGRGTDPTSRAPIPRARLAGPLHRAATRVRRVVCPCSGRRADGTAVSVTSRV